MSLHYEEQAALLLSKAHALNLKIAIAESCTGGLLTATLTAIAGSSDVVERGFVTYSNQAKHDLLGVPYPLLETYGAVSKEVAISMAEGALKHAPVQLTVSITGIAGPSGGSTERPVGLVHIASAMKGKNTAHKHYVFSGDREEVRSQSVKAALELMLTHLGF